jgi:hypothetical protein
LAAWTNHAINQPVVVAPPGKFSLNFHTEIDWIPPSGLWIQVIRRIIGIPAIIPVSVVPLGIPGIRVVKPEEPQMREETGDSIEKAIMVSLPFRRSASHRDRCDGKGNNNHCHEPLKTMAPLHIRGSMLHKA